MVGAQVVVSTRNVPSKSKLTSVVSEGVPLRHNLLIQNRIILLLKEILSIAPDNKTYF